MDRVTSFSTLEEAMLAANNRSSGFDYMRLMLALAVFGCHMIDTNYAFDAQQQALALAWRPVVAAILPMFFALSGFLVAGSLERCRTLVAFFGLRALRIVPALAGEVVLSALILGPAFTTFDLRDYFGDRVFRAYFLNIVGDIHYSLPGVFLHNPRPNVVNGQLWTVPYELACYLLLGGIALCGIVKNRKWLLAFMLGAYLFQALRTVYDLHQSGPAKILYGSVGGRTLVMVFVAGIVLYRFRGEIVLRRSFFYGALLVSAVLLCLPPYGERLVALPIAYFTIYLGLSNPPRNWLIEGDYSYGLYLYGCPLQQAFAAFGPEFRNWTWQLFGALPCVAACAYWSWWHIERPALALRTPVRRLEQIYLRWRNAL